MKTEECTFICNKRADGEIIVLSAKGFVPEKMLAESNRLADFKFWGVNSKIGSTPGIYKWKGLSNKSKDDIYLFSGSFEYSVIQELQN